MARIGSGWSQELLLSFLMWEAGIQALGAYSAAFPRHTDQKWTSWDTSWHPYRIPAWYGGGSPSWSQLSQSFTSYSTLFSRLWSLVRTQVHHSNWTIVLMVQMLDGTPAFHNGVLAFDPWLCSQLQTPADADLEGRVDNWSDWIPDTHVGDRGWVPGSWLQAGPAPANASTEEVK